MMKCCKYALMEPKKKENRSFVSFFFLLLSFVSSFDKEGIFSFFNLFYLQNSPLGMFL